MAVLIPSWSIWLLAVLTFPTYLVKCGPCTLKPKKEVYDGYTCGILGKVIEATCQSYVSFAQEICLEKYTNSLEGLLVEADYNYHSYTVYVNEPRGENLFNVKVKNFRGLTLINGNLTTIPVEVRDMHFLENITISGNKINTLNLVLFHDMHKLQRINFTHNMIKLIKPDIISYESHVTDFDLSYNYIEVLPDNFLEQFINLQYLNFSNNKIKKLSDNNFITLSKLLKLDVSFNNIQNIANNTFTYLTQLEQLDLGHNKLDNITKELFHKNSKLYSVSLLNNQIKSIEVNTFNGLPIRELRLQNNNLTGEIQKGIFSGLNISELDLSRENITSLCDFAYVNMYELKCLNLSFNSIEKIDSLAFFSLVLMSELDLSNNKLKDLYFESSTLTQLSRIHAHHNNIEHINKNFYRNDVNQLTLLDLSHNNIKELESLPLFTKNLHLDLSSNTNLKVYSNSFNIATQLRGLTLQNVRTNFTFENSSATIEFLKLQACGIADLNKLFISNIKNTRFLNLSANEITVVDKNSLENMTNLESLDLSLNKIAYIQPGSFLHSKQLTSLNLFGNSLSSLQLGVFNGPKELRDLNLSQNMLRVFDANCFISVVKLSLDNNVVTSLNIPDIFNTNIRELSIIGNQLPCNVIADMLKQTHNSRRITFATSLNYYTENVNGIPCAHVANDDSKVTSASDNYSANITSIIHLLGDALENINLSLQNIARNSKKTRESLETLLITTKNKLTGINGQLLEVKQ